MDHFTYRHGLLHAEDVPMTAIAEAVGTPVYIYSRATLERHARVFREALSGLPRTHIAFAIKANPNLAVLKVLARQGFGADVVSGGEVARALAAGMNAQDIVFSGVGKTRAEIQYALDANVGQFNIELEEEGTVLAVLGVPFKCPPAPYEAVPLLHDHLVARGLRESCTLEIITPMDSPVPVSPSASFS